MKLEWADYASIQAQWEPILKRAHTQLVREHSATVVSLAEPLWTDSGVKGGISVREQISTSKKKEKKKKAQAGNEWSNIIPKSSQARKKPPPPLRGFNLQGFYLSCFGSAVLL